MNRYEFRVVLYADSLGEADKVMRERLLHEEDYGFPYTIAGWSEE